MLGLGLVLGVAAVDAGTSAFLGFGLKPLQPWCWCQENMKEKNKIGNVQSNSKSLPLSLFYLSNLFCPILILLILVSISPIVPVHILVLLPSSSRCVD